MTKANVASRVGARMGTKTAVRKRCQGRTKGTLARARRGSYSPVVGVQRPVTAEDFKAAGARFTAAIAPVIENVAKMSKALATVANSFPPQPDGSCHATTTKGTPCKRTARPESLYCTTHVEWSK